MEKASKVQANSARGVFFIRDKQGKIHAHKIDMNANAQFLRDRRSENYLPHGKIFEDMRAVLGDKVLEQNMVVSHMNKLIAKDAELGLDK